MQTNSQSQILEYFDGILKQEGKKLHDFGIGTTVMPVPDFTRDSPSYLVSSVFFIEEPLSENEFKVLGVEFSHTSPVTIEGCKNALESFAEKAIIIKSGEAFPDSKNWIKL